MRKYLLTLWSFLMLLFLFISCKKEVSLPSIEKIDNSVIFPTTQKEKERVQTIKEIGSILKEIYRKAWVVFEVNAAIKTEYYEDETVLLRDLLTPESSPLYKTQKFISSGAKEGIFKKAFAEELQKGNYPNLKRLIGQPSSALSRATSEWPSVDTTSEIWTDQYGYSIYFPYSEDYPLINPLDPSINTANGQLVTIVSADREADSGPGWEPYYKEYDPNGFNCPDNICYNQVTVDDNYADGDYGHHPTHIVGVGVEPTRIQPTNPPPGTNVNRIYHGWSSLNQQLDKFISSAGNGGGSEIKVCRISGYLQFQNQQVTNFTGDLFTVSYKRKEIRKGKWKRVYGVWDPDWVPGNLEQVYAVYEDDQSGSKTFTGSLGTTVTISPGTTITGNIGYSITVQTQDELVTQRKITRSAYFGAALTDQGWGFNLCDKNGSDCRYDNTFLTTGNWPAYDGNSGSGAIWRYTWPYNSY